MARYINGEFGIGVDLKVIPADGLEADDWFDETGLPWINPSPNIRSLEAALNYSGLVLSEATNLTVGRGTGSPFSYLGAPWLDTNRLMGRLADYSLPGVTIDSTTFTPGGEGYVPFTGEQVHAVRLNVTDRNVYMPVWTTLVLLSEIKRLHPQQFRVTNEGFTQMIGSRWAREAFDRGDSPASIWERWERELRSWEQLVAKYRIY
jgi:uncharacterized protein YbbC (DUF1343 family)